MGAAATRRSPRARTKPWGRRQLAAAPGRPPPALAEYSRTRRLMVEFAEVLRLTRLAGQVGLGELAGLVDQFQPSGRGGDRTPRLADLGRGETQTATGRPDASADRTSPSKLSSR
jgi:hypothetical protein